MPHLPPVVLSVGDGEKGKEMSTETFRILVIAFLLITVYLPIGMGVSQMIVEDVNTKVDLLKYVLWMIAWPLVLVYSLLVLIPMGLIKLWIDLPDTDEQIEKK